MIGKCRRRVAATEDSEFECLSVLHEHSQDVKCVRWNPSRAGELASCGYDDSIRFWAEAPDDGSGDYDDEWRCTATLSAHSNTVWAVAFHRENADRFASCSDDLTIRIWQAAAASSVSSSSVPPPDARSSGYRNVCTLSGHHARCIFALDWSPTGGFLASGGADDAIVIFRERCGDDSGQSAAAASASGECAYEVALRLDRAHDADVNCLAWAPARVTAGTSASANASASASTDAGDGTFANTNSATDAGGRVLASASDDGTIKIWRFLAPDV
jgi:WD40 repeat protein